MRLSILVLTAALWWTGGALAVANPSPLPVPNVPTDVLHNPIVQSVLNALGGSMQTTNGPTASGRVKYFKRFELQVETRRTSTVTSTSIRAPSSTHAERRSRPA